MRRCRLAAWLVLRRASVVDEAAQGPADGGRPLERRNLDGQRQHGRQTGDLLALQGLFQTSFIWHANAAVDKLRRIEQRSDKSLKGMRWSLLKDRASLRPADAADLDALIARMTTVRTARAWVYKEQLREILERKRIHVVRDMLKHWCTCVMRSRVEPMKEVAAMVRRHLEGVVAWAQTRQTNGFLEAPRSRLHQLRHHQNRHLPDRRQARLRLGQPPCPVTHLKAKRASQQGPRPQAAARR